MQPRPVSNSLGSPRWPSTLGVPSCTIQCQDYSYTTVPARQAVSSSLSCIHVESKVRVCHPCIPSKNSLNAPLCTFVQNYQFYRIAQPKFPGNITNISKLCKVGSPCQPSPAFKNYPRSPFLREAHFSFKSVAGVSLCPFHFLCPLALVLPGSGTSSQNGPQHMHYPAISRRLCLNVTTVALIVTHTLDNKLLISLLLIMYL